MSKILISCLVLCLLPQIVSSSCCAGCSSVDSVNAVCITCELDYYLYESKVCIDSCPYGFTDDGTSCTVDDPTVLNIDFSL